MKSHDITFIFYTLCINTWIGIMCSPCALTQTDDSTAGLSWMRKANMMVAPRISFHFREQRPRRCPPSEKVKSLYLVCNKSSFVLQAKNTHNCVDKDMYFEVFERETSLLFNMQFPLTGKIIKVAHSGFSPIHRIWFVDYFSLSVPGLFCGEVLSSCVGSPAYVQKE